jgi:hypothetical protein
MLSKFHIYGTKSRNQNQSISVKKSDKYHHQVTKCSHIVYYNPRVKR